MKLVELLLVLALVLGFGLRELHALRRDRRSAERRPDQDDTGRRE